MDKKSLFLSDRSIIDTMINQLNVKRIITAVTASVVMACVYGQNLYEDNIRYWDQGPLKWNYFQTRTIPKKNKKVTELNYGIKFTNDITKLGNLHYSEMKSRTYMNRILSWYDPDRCDEWTLRYHQTAFDIVESIRRRYQAAFNHNPKEEYLWMYYNDLIESSLQAFDMESDGGKDSTVIMRYEHKYRAQLDSLEYNPVLVPQFNTGNHGFSFFIGMFHEHFLTGASEGISSVTGLTVGFGYHYKRIYSFVGMSIGGGGKLKKPLFYYDSKMNYNWRQGIGITGEQYSFNVGYRLFDHQYFAITPFAGIGATALSQQSDVPLANKSERFEKSRFSDFRAQAGIMADIKVSRKLSGMYYHSPYNSYSPEFYSESKIRLQLYGAYTDFKTAGTTFSLNLGLTYCYDIWGIRF